MNVMLLIFDEAKKKKRNDYFKFLIPTKWQME